MDDQQVWKRKWTIAMIFIWIVGLAAIGILAYFLIDELKDDVDEGTS